MPKQPLQNSRVRHHLEAHASEEVARCLRATLFVEMEDVDAANLLGRSSGYQRALKIAKDFTGLRARTSAIPPIPSRTRTESYLAIASEIP